MLEDLKLRTFKEILTSFEKNDFAAFEKLMRQEKELMDASKRMTQKDGHSTKRGGDHVS